MLRTVVSLSVALALTACSPQNTTSETPSQAQAEQQALQSGVIKENMDLSVDPGNDFFSYVNGKWVDTLRSQQINLAMVRA